jgi:hypothetical protein
VSGATTLAAHVKKRILGAASGLVVLSRLFWLIIGLISSADRSFGFAIKPHTHFFSSFEEGNGLLCDLDDDASTRVTPRVCSAGLGRKRSETPQLDSITALQSFGDFVQYCGDDLINVSLKKVRVLSGNTLY